MNIAAPAPKENMGSSVMRSDAHIKVTGRAKYASDFPVSNPVYAYLVVSSIAKGKITDLDVSAAISIAGVLHIMTYKNTVAPADIDLFSKGGHASTTIQPLRGPEIRHDGEIVAVVLAETYEVAREAANKVRVTYIAETPSGSLESKGVTLEDAVNVSPRHKDPKIGDAVTALGSAGVKVEQEYSTPAQHHNPIELFSTTCEWQGDELTVYEPSQFVTGLSAGLAKQLSTDARKVHVVSPYVGGAFGSKGSLTPRTALIAIAAKKLGRPVKLVVTRSQGFTVTTYRAETKHRVKLGASKDGQLVAYSHEAWELSSRSDRYIVGGNVNSVVMYACPNVWTKVHVVHADRNTPGFMRSPPEVPYIFALETAMDELAIALDMDPVELRRKNDTLKSPINGAPFTSRSLGTIYLT